MSLAFEGVRILDFTQLLSGPLATQQLALLGANVIKVERPGVGDQFANVMHTDATRQQGRSYPFQSANLSKRSLAIDLKHPRAAAVLMKVVSSCDAVVENFAGGNMARLGLDYESVKVQKSDIVYCSVSGYGQTGPRAGAPAYDGAIQAASGMMSVTGDERSGPMRTGYMPVDIATALMAAFALTAGLYRKLATGQGQYIDVSMMDTAVFLQMPNFVNYINANVEPALLGNRSVSGSPTSDAFATRDGHVLLTTISEKQVKALFMVLGLSQLLEDSQYADEAARLRNQSSLRPILDKAFAAESSGVLQQKLTAAGVSCSEIKRLPDVVTDAQFDHRSIFRRVAAVGTNAEMTAVTTGYSMSGDEMKLGPAPALGQHTEEILGEAGFTDRDVARFRAESLI